MSNMQGATRAQTIFLRSFRTHPFGPPPELWPSPAILRKWLRKPTFRSAFLSLRQALNFRSDFHLASAAANAALSLTSSELAAEPSALSPLLQVLRLSHLRQRFNPDPPAPDPAIRNQRKDDLEIILDLLNTLPDQPSKLIIHLFNKSKEKHEDSPKLAAIRSPIPTPDFFEASDDPDEN